MAKLYKAAFLGLFLSLGLVFPQTAFAAPVIDQSQSISSTGTGSSFCMVDNDDSFSDDIGSTFTAGVSGTLTSLEIPIFGSSTSESLSVLIYEISDGSITNPPLASQTISDAVLASVADGGTLSVVFTSPATIVSGGDYAFAMKFLSCTSFGQVVVQLGESPADKRAIYNQNNDATWATDNQYGMSFTTYVEALPAQSTPDPSPEATTAPELAVTGSHNLFDSTSWGFVTAFVIGLGLFLLTVTSRARGEK